MSFVSLLIIALILAMDAFTVCVCTGVNTKKVALRFATTFALFQTIMPLLGYLFGNSLNNYFKNYDHWIAFILLLAIGIKIIHEDVKNNKSCNTNINYFSYKILILLALATSIDAFVVGITFAFIDVNLYFALITIGLVTFILSIIGIELGNKLKKLVNANLNIYAGAVLILLGIKILIEHLID